MNELRVGETYFPSFSLQFGQVHADRFGRLLNTPSFIDDEDEGERKGSC